MKQAINFTLLLPILKACEIAESEGGWVRLEGPGGAAGFCVEDWKEAVELSMDQEIHLVAVEKREGIFEKVWQKA